MAVKMRDYIILNGIKNAHAKFINDLKQNVKGTVIIFLIRTGIRIGSYFNLKNELLVCIYSTNIFQF